MKKFNLIVKSGNRVITVETYNQEYVSIENLQRKLDRLTKFGYTYEIDYFVE